VASTCVDFCMQCLNLPPCLPVNCRVQDHIPKAVRGNVGDVLRSKDQRGICDKLLKELDLEQVRGHSGGGL
jgi:translation initiation factor RLI1